MRVFHLQVVCHWVVYPQGVVQSSSRSSCVMAGSPACWGAPLHYASACTTATTLRTSAFSAKVCNNYILYVIICVRSILALKTLRALQSCKSEVNLPVNICSDWIIQFCILAFNIAILLAVICRYCSILLCYLSLSPSLQILMSAWALTAAVRTV